MASKTFTNGDGPAFSRDLLANGRMLTVSEAATMMNVHPNSLRRWADMELLPSYRIGVRGDRRFNAHDLSEFLEAYKKYRRNGAAMELYSTSPK